ncbi:MAG: hypothetical protein V3W37_01875 [Candidatus Binatia bacterium]
MNSFDECRLSPRSCPSEIGATGVVTDGKRPKLAIRCVRWKGPVLDQKAVVEPSRLGRGKVTLS